VFSRGVEDPASTLEYRCQLMENSVTLEQSFVYFRYGVFIHGVEQNNILPFRFMLGSKKNSVGGKNRELVGLQEANIFF
jgi:hypothetical protein